MPQCKDESIKFVEKCFAKYFAKLETISKENPPIGKNAVSHKFRDEILNIDLSSIEQDIKNINFSMETKALYGIYIEFTKAIREGFQNYDNYTAYWYRRTRIIVDNFSDMSVDGLAERIAVSFLPLLTGVALPILINTLYEATQTTFKAIQNSNLIWSGTHANGWLSYVIHDAAQTAKKRIDDNFANYDNPLVEKLYTTFSIFSEIDRKSKHHTWLAAKWQLSFEMVCHVWSLDLRKLSDTNMENEFQKFAAQNPFPAGESAFNFIVATWLAYISKLAYWSPKQIGNSLSSIGFIDTVFFEYGSHQAILTKFREEKPFIVIAFRGTEPDDYRDILTDIVVMKRKHESRNFNIHAGFFEAFKILWGTPTDYDNIKIEGNKGIINYLSKINLEKNIPIYITGHSLGGAIATLAAYEYNPTATYTFGQPRVGDKSFLEHFEANTKLSKSFYRIVNNADIVSRIPSQNMGFQHVGNLKSFNHKGELSEENITRYKPFFSGVKSFKWIFFLSVIFFVLLLPHTFMILQPILLLNQWLNQYLTWEFTQLQILGTAYVLIFMALWILKEKIFTYLSKILPLKSSSLMPGHSMIEDHGIDRYIINCQKNIRNE
ncbi:MAG: hypothetical protein HUU50_09085 [Candidatus Brocadiae bacterium]|nr:hypothetical protein [Candidatus Brocadiia bacterium]